MLFACFIIVFNFCLYTSYKTELWKKAVFVYRIIVIFSLMWVFLLRECVKPPGGFVCVLPGTTGRVHPLMATVLQDPLIWSWAGLHVVLSRLPGHTGGRSPTVRVFSDKPAPNLFLTQFFVMPVMNFSVVACAPLQDGPAPCSYLKPNLPWAYLQKEILRSCYTPTTAPPNPLHCFRINWN